MTGRFDDYAGDRSAQASGPGWVFYIPPEVDEARSYVIIRLNVERPGEAPNGWLGMHVRESSTAESFQDDALDAVVAWARRIGVKQILVEDERTHELSLVR